MNYVLDSNTFSAVVRRVPLILQRYEGLARASAMFFVCPVVYFEVRRGFEKLNASRQLVFLEKTVNVFTWSEINREDWSLAATVWANSQNDGFPVGDMDILIAVFAARRDAVVVTKNSRHFEILTHYLSFQYENWFE